MLSMMQTEMMSNSSLNINEYNDNSKLKVSYVSDLHLEFQTYPSELQKDEGGDILILAGDILVASYLFPNRTDKDARSARKSLEKLKKDLFDKYDHILYIIGNHEHYHGIYPKTLNYLKNAFNDIGLSHKTYILEDNHIIINNVVFIGATLWTDFLNNNYSAMHVAETNMNDFHIIGSMDVEHINYYNRYENRKISPQFVYNVHKNSLKYFDEITKIHSNKKCVIISHHAPTYKSLNKKHSGSMLDGAYASNLSDFIFDHPNIKYWIHGHCHMNTDYMVDTCRVLSNQRGYHGEQSYNEFVGLKSFYP